MMIIENYEFAPGVFIPNALIMARSVVIQSFSVSVDTDNGLVTVPNRSALCTVDIYTSQDDVFSGKQPVKTIELTFPYDPSKDIDDQINEELKIGI